MIPPSSSLACSEGTSFDPGGIDTLTADGTSSICDRFMLQHRIDCQLTLRKDIMNNEPEYDSWFNLTLIAWSGKPFRPCPLQNRRDLATVLEWQEQLPFRVTAGR